MCRSGMQASNKALRTSKSFSGFKNSKSARRIPFWPLLASREHFPAMTGKPGWDVHDTHSWLFLRLPLAGTRLAGVRLAAARFTGFSAMRGNIPNGGTLMWRAAYV
jgi:hypothetical protein